LRSPSRIAKGERGVWQRRYFEHTCRDDADLKRCVDYVHVNPINHGLVNRVIDWPWSSFHRYVRLGEYEPGWGNANVWYGDEWKDFE
jgi:putative transposase